MSRKCRFVPRRLVSDIRYNSNLVAYFINMVMRNGKKLLATRIVYGSFSLVEKKMKNNDVFTIFKRALNHIRPLVEVKSRRVGGATYQVPVEVTIKRSTTLAIRWLITFSKKRDGKNMVENLANEIIDAADEVNFIGKSVGRGGAVKKREDTHRMAEANKAFSHYSF